ncbi:MAG: substrate-binding domain-containing protein [Actinomycetota bacterium]
MLKRFLPIIIIVSVALSFTLAIPGCTSLEEVAEEPVAEEPVTEEPVAEEPADITVGFSLPFIEDSPYTFPYAQALREAAEDRGWEIIMTDAGGDIHTQGTQIESMVEQGIDALMIMPVDAAGIVPIIEGVYEATNGELPMICSNVMPDPPELDELVAFAGPDSYSEALLMAERYVQYLDENNIDTINYTHITGTAGYSAAIDRERGFYDKLEEMGASDRFNRLDLQPGDWSPDKAQELTETWITTHGDNLEMIYSHNDGMAIGIIRALQDAGYEPGQVITNGCDGQPEVIELIMEGWALFTVWQSPREDALTSFEVMEKILAGEEVEYWNFMDTPIVDASNAEDYIEESRELWEMLQD